MGIACILFDPGRFCAPACLARSSLLELAAGDVKATRAAVVFCAVLPQSSLASCAPTPKQQAGSTQELILTLKGYARCIEKLAFSAEFQAAEYARKHADIFRNIGL